MVYRFYAADFPTSGGRRWEDAQFNELFQRAKGTLDERQRAGLYQQAAQYIHEQAPALFLWLQVRQAAYDPRRIEYGYKGYFADMWVSGVNLRN